MKIKLILAMFLASILGGIPAYSYAASKDECAIWICLPGGFPSGCSAAKSAFKKRIKHHKPPLPAFSACAVKKSGGSSMTYSQGRAVYVPAVTCGFGGIGGSVGGYGSYGGYGGLGGFGTCKSSPARWVKGGRCPTFGCPTKRYLDVFVDGKGSGGTYYF